MKPLHLQKAGSNSLKERESRNLKESKVLETETHGPFPTIIALPAFPP